MSWKAKRRPISVCLSSIAAISAKASRSSRITCADAGALHLDGHRRGRRAARARWTCPSEAAASGLGSKSEKALEIRTPELGRDDLLDLARRRTARRGPAGGPARRDRAGQEVGAGGEELAELDEGRPQRLEVLGELLRVAADGLLHDLVVRQIDVDRLDQVRPPVLDQQAGDVGIAFQMLRLERERHSRILDRKGPTASIAGLCTAGARRGRFSPPRPAAPANPRW